MGAKESLPNFSGDFIEQNWSQVQNSSNANPVYGTFRQLCNNMTREVLDEFRVTCTSEEEFLEHLEWFRIRKREERLVQANYLLYEGRRQLCSTLFRIQMFIEKMSVRLSDIKDIPVPENLYVLQASLIGFRFLFQLMGYFPISQDLICMDQEGNVKVWLHPDFSSIKPLRLPVADPTQSRMVTELIQIIHRNTDPNEDLSPLPQFIHKVKQKQLTFQHALELIDVYASEFNVKIPRYFETIITKIRIDQGVECSSQSQTKKGNLLSVGNEYVRNSLEYLVYSSVYKSDSSRTYADKLKAFDSQILYPRRGILGHSALQKSQAVVEAQEKVEGEELQKKIGLYRSQCASCENLNTYFQAQKEKKPQIRFTFVEEVEKTVSQQNTNNHNQDSENHESSLHCQEVLSDTPISPQDQMSPCLKKLSQKQWMKEIMECGVDIDPQIVEDLIKLR